MILVDDESTDGSGECCDRYTSDSRVRVIRKANGGRSSARNAGLDIAKGDFIGFCDCDDYFHPQMIEVLVRAALDNHCEMSMCGYSCVKEQSPCPTETHYEVNDVLSHQTAMVQRDDLYARMYHPNFDTWVLYTYVWNKLYSRKLIGNARFEDGSAEDTCFNSVVYKAIDKAVVVDVPLYRYLIRASSISHSQKSIALEDLFVYYHVYRDILNDTPRYAAHCLAFLYKRFVSAQLWYRGTQYESRLREIYGEVKRNTLSLYLKDRNTPWTQKAYFLLFWYCPWIYTFCSERLLPLLQRLRSRH